MAEKSGNCNVVNCMYCITSSLAKLKGILS